MEQEMLTIGQIDFREDQRLFGIKSADRTSHLYLLGQTGTGKTTLLEYMIRQDMRAGRGCAVFDPHGDLATSLSTYAKSLGKNPIILDIGVPGCHYGYNPIRRVSERLRPLLASGILEIFKKLWADAWGVKMEHILRNTILTLLDQPAATFADIPRILTDKSYRDKALPYITNPHVKNFWLKEFNKYAKRYVHESIAPVMNKVGGFLAHPVLAEFLTSPEETFSLRQIMDEGQILIINLSKGRLGEDASNLVGSLLMTSIGLCAFSRADLAAHDRRAFYVYADEFHHFTTLSLITMASELRKYGVILVCANQYLLQLSPEVKSAVIGNFGSLICFRLGAEDALFMQQEFVPTLRSNDFISMPNYHFYVRMMIDGKPSVPFSGKTIFSSVEKHSSKESRLMQ